MATLKFEVITVNESGEIAMLESPCALDPTSIEREPSEPSAWTFTWILLTNYTRR